MQKYKLKIVPQDKAYVGYALENDEVVFQTEPCRDAVTASRELSKLIDGKQPVVINKSKSSVQVLPTKQFSLPPSANPVIQPVPQQAPRKCCGRG